MNKRLLVVLVAVVAIAAITGGVLALAGGANDETVSGSQADSAVKAALEATNGGTANSVELDDENGATWEVEVTKPNGTTVDVRLDEDYKVVVIEVDEEEPGEDEDDDEDEDEDEEDR